jgi:hypothetical protein
MPAVFFISANSGPAKNNVELVAQKVYGRQSEPKNQDDQILIDKANLGAITSACICLAIH